MPEPKLLKVQPADDASDELKQRWIDETPKRIQAERMQAGRKEAKRKRDAGEVLPTRTKKQPKWKRQYQAQEVLIHEPPGEMMAKWKALEERRPFLMNRPDGFRSVYSKSALVN